MVLSTMKENSDLWAAFVGRTTAANLGLPAGGIRRPHPRPDIGGTRVREPLVVIRQTTPLHPPDRGFEIKTWR